jgi:hypothetical protein
MDSRITLPKYPFVESEETLPKSEISFLNKMRRYGIFVEPVEDFKRIYPNGTMAAHASWIHSIT